MSYLKTQLYRRERLMLPMPCMTTRPSFLGGRDSSRKVISTSFPRTTSWQRLFILLLTLGPSPRCILVIYESYPQIFRDICRHRWPLKMTMRAPQLQDLQAQQSRNQRRTLSVTVHISPAKSKWREFMIISQIGGRPELNWITLHGITCCCR